MKSNMFVVTGLFLAAIFTRDTNKFELLSQQPASIFYPGQNQYKTGFAPRLQNQTDLRWSPYSPGSFF